MVQEDKVAEDMLVPGDQRTASLVQEIANKICTFIQMEVDYPSRYEDNFVPILDLKVGVQDKKVVYKHFRKPCCSFLTIVANSAMPNRGKRACLVQEVVRVCRNTSRLLPAVTRNDSLSEFSFRMKESGYGEAFRLEVISCGLESYDKQVQREVDGTCPLYRPKGYKEEERRRKKELAKYSWYRPFEAVLFCPPTPDSVLASKFRKIVREEEERGGMKVKVLERAGVKLSLLLPGLKEEQVCEVAKCMMHLTGGKGDHSKEGVVYRGDCLTCLEEGPGTYPDPDREGEVVRATAPAPGTKSSYWGESAFCMLERGGEHHDALGHPQQHQDNAYVNHASYYHRDRQVQEVSYKLNLLYTCDKAMQRQISEGVEIRHGEEECDILMNSKLDHYAPAVGRMVMERGVAERGRGRGQGARRRGQ